MRTNWGQQHSDGFEQDAGLLPVVKAAAHIGLRPSTIRSWILQRRIPYVKLGGRVFLRRTDLQKLIEASVVPARTRK